MVLAWQFFNFYNRNHYFSYPLDDTYIHLGIAKNLAQHGIWGITPFEFSSASSSILYTLLLATSIKLFGANTFLPLIINYLSFIGLVLVSCQIAKKERFKVSQLILLTIALFFVPITALVMSGMEHVLQLVLFVQLVHYSSFIVNSASENLKTKHYFLWFLISALAVAVRFEGLFIIAAISTFLLFQKKIQLAIQFVAVSVFPVIAYGVYSLKQGGYFLPNSLLLKGDRPHLSLSGLLSYSHAWVDKLMLTPHLLVLMIVLLIVLCASFLTEKIHWPSSKLFLWFTLITFGIHMVLARVGWFYRYEGYIVYLGLFSIALNWNSISYFWILGFQKTFLTKLILGVLIFVLSYPLMERSVSSIKNTPVAMQNIFDQQIQMSKFVNHYYNNSILAANDIGAISYFTNISLVDIFGLASKEVMNLRANNQYDKIHLEKLCIDKKVEIAIIYKEWFEGKIPNAWVECGSMEIENNFICAHNKIYFYAAKPEYVKQLKLSLINFSKTSTIPIAIH